MREQMVCCRCGAEALLERRADGRPWLHPCNRGVPARTGKFVSVGHWRTLQMIRSWFRG